jgi:hypothetical protein
MNLAGASGVSPGKVEALLERIRALGLNPALIQEQFVRGGGPGGQKINKTSNCVLLRYEPLGIVVRCQEDRHRSVNRFLALRELVDQVEMKISPLTSPPSYGRGAGASGQGPGPPPGPPPAPAAGACRVRLGGGDAADRLLQRGGPGEDLVDADRGEEMPLRGVGRPHKAQSALDALELGNRVAQGIDPGA